MSRFIPSKSISIAMAFVGNYKLTKSENFDEFLKEMGVGMIKRKLANSTSPELEITQVIN